MNEPIAFSNGIEISAPIPPTYADILTFEAMEFISKLHRSFEPRRRELLQLREDRQKALDAGQLPNFLEATAKVREDASWRVATIPRNLQKRWVEITGPTDRKMMINALNSGADVFMADFEDANSPTWSNMIEGQANLRDAIDRTISFTSQDGKQYRLNDEIAVLMVRPRGWHLVEKHCLVDNQPVSASLFDFGLFFYHNARRMIARGSGPNFYLPKIESHLEARLWNEVFNLAQNLLDLRRGTIRATVLIETVLAAFEMEEILYELRDHITALNAGRWDYIFSIIKKFHRQPGFILPDRAQISMTVPFMRAYTELLVRTCHKRGAHAIGGMAAYIPNRKNPEINDMALTRVRDDKLREVKDGFDGTWVAHPDLVHTAREVFQNALQDRTHQKERLREDVRVGAGQLTDFSIPGGTISESGLRTNINVGILYIESWLRGIGAAAIYNLMEDTATAEISRAQVWQWLQSPLGRLGDGRRISPDMVHNLVAEEMTRIEELWGAELFRAGKFEQARSIFENLVMSETFTQFLTLAAYPKLD